MNASISIGNGSEREDEWCAALINPRSATPAQEGAIQPRHHFQNQLDATPARLTNVQVRMICRPRVTWPMTGLVPIQLRFAGPTYLRRDLLLLVYQELHLLFLNDAQDRANPDRPLP